MPTYFPEGDTTEASDDPRRSLQKWNQLLYTAGPTALTFFPEGTLPKSGDDEGRSLIKINALIGAVALDVGPSFFPEAATPEPTDSPRRSLQKISALLGQTTLSGDGEQLSLQRIVSAYASGNGPTFLPEGRLSKRSDSAQRSLWKIASLVAVVGDPPPPPPPDPPVTDGLIGWFAGRKMVGMTNGDAVETWQDSWINDNDLTNLTVGAVAGQPTYLTNQVNSQPAVYFPAHQYLSKSAITAGTVTGLTIVSVLGAAPVANLGSTTAVPIMTFSAGQAIRLFQVPAAAANTNAFRFDCGGSSISSTVLQANNAWSGFTSRFLRSTKTLSLDTFLAQAVTPVVAGNDFVDVPFQITLGSTQPGSLNGFSGGKIAEMLIYNRKLSDADVLLVEQWLKDIYFPA